MLRRAAVLKNKKTILEVTMLRKFAVVSCFLGLAAFAQGCGNDCDAAADDISAKQDECGIDAPSDDGGDTAETVECTDALGTAALCTADCYTAASCETLKGEDVDGAADFATCLADCQ